MSILFDSMNILDLFLAVPLLWGAYKGFTRGIIYEIAMILGLIAGLYVAFKFSGLVQGWIFQLVNKDSALPAWVGFFIVSGIIMAVFILYARLLEGILKAGDLNLFNKIIGGVFGLLKYALVLSVFLWLLKSLEPHLNFINTQTKKESKLYEPVLKTSTFLTPALQDIKNEFRQHIEDANH
ncbi:MAG TPA: CvpA family protein [Bacteroidia bacterium]|nr:CvpA family protein [Bacteroidia bacterium]HMU18924.1 CvpA family protein [Bacteroidia bacterium]